MSAAALASASWGELWGEIRRRVRVGGRAGTVRAAGLEVDVSSGAVRWRGLAARLTRREVEVLVALMAAGPGGATGAELLEAVWSGLASPDSPRVAIAALRRRLPAVVDPPCRHGALLGRPARYRLAVWNDSAGGP